MRLATLSLAFSLLAACCQTAAAAPPSENFLPNTTKGFISLPVAEVGKEAFNNSQLGELFNDPKMDKFRDSLEKQLEDKGRLAERLGIALSDLDFVDKGQIAIAVIQPDGHRKAFATALIVDVTGHGGAKGEGVKLLSKALERQKKKGGKIELFKFGAINGRVVVMPEQKDRPLFGSYYFFFGTLLVCVDHQKEALAIHHRLEKGGGDDSLANLPAFKESMAHAKAAFGTEQPHAKIFLEPIGYSQIGHAEQWAFGEAKPIKKGGNITQAEKDLQVMINQGFDAVQGIGAWVDFDAEGYEAVYRAHVYAPAVDRAAKDEETLARIKEEERSKEPKFEDAFTKYFLTARILNFPNKAGLAPPDWIGKDLAECMPFNWKTRHAFTYSESYFDEDGGEKRHGGLWRDILDGIRDDEEGPQVDIRKDIIGNLSDECVQIVDYNTPIDAETERRVLAIKVAKNEADLKAALDKMMEDDEDAKLHKVGKVHVWELRPADDRDEEDSVQAVVHGWYLRSVHVDVVKRLCAEPAMADVLSKQKEYAAVMGELKKLGAGEDAARNFSYTDKSMRPHWELWKAGLMPEANTMLAGMLNNMMGFVPGEKPFRKQEIDASALPDFEVAIPYLGPSGYFATTEEDGWMVQGMLMTKE